MTDQTVDPSVDNSTTGAQDNAQTPPVTDNGVKPKTVEELQAEVVELNRLNAEKSRKLNASKEEALRLKKEAEEARKPAPSTDTQPTVVLTEQEKAILRANGFITKEQMDVWKQEQIQAEFQRNEQEALQDFFKKFPEYAPENDLDATKFDSLKEALGIYKIPTDKNGIYRVLVKSHGDITGSNDLEKGKSLGMAEANLADKAKQGGGGSGINSSTKKKTPEQLSVSEAFKKARPDYYE